MTRSVRILSAFAGLIAVGIGLATPAPPPSAAVVGVAAGHATPGPMSDPFPLRRLFVPAERLSPFLAKEATGELIRVPRDDFEAKIQAATRATLDGPPRLVSAIFRADLTEGGLVGTATFRVVAPGPGRLPLDPFRSAITSVRRTTEGSPVLLVPVDAGGYALIPPVGDTEVSLDWSARGTAEPGSERFDLAFPPATSTVLEVEVLADRTLAVASPDQFLTGPFPGRRPESRLWRVRCGTPARVELSIRKPGLFGEPTPIVRANRTARFELTPGLAVGTFEFNIASVRGNPKSFLFEADVGFRITEVTGSGRLSWQTEPGTPAKVRVTPADPAAVGRISVIGYAALPAGANSWTCPRVRLVNGLPGMDVIEFRLDPTTGLAGFEVGDYRVTSAGVDRGYRITLTGSLLAAGEARPDRRPPTLRLRPADAAYTASEDQTWRIGTGRTELSVRLRVKVIHGPLGQLPVTVPAGYTPTGCTLLPDDPGLVWTAGGPGLVIEPSRPWTAGQSVELRLDLRGPAGPPALDPASEPIPTRLPFPKVTLAGAAERDGTLTVTVPANLRAWSTPTGPPADPLVIPFRGKPTDGTLTIIPRAHGTIATSQVMLARETNIVTATVRFPIDPGVNEIGAVTLFAPKLPTGEWQISGPAGAMSDRRPGGSLVPWLSEFGGNGWSALVGVGVGPVLAGDLWTVHLPRSSTDRIVVTARCSLPGGDGVRFPLPVPLGCRLGPPQVELDPVLGAKFQAIVNAHWPTSVSLIERGQLGTESLVLPGLFGWQVIGLELVTRLESDGRLSCTLSGRVTTAAGTYLPLQLPAGAELGEVLVAGRFVEIGSHATHLQVPIPTPGESGVPFEVRYQLPGTNGSTGAMMSVTSPVPEVGGESQQVIQKWTVASRFRRWPDLASSHEPVVEQSDHLVVIRGAVVDGIGFGLAAIIVALGWAGRRGSRSRTIGLVALLVVMGFTVRIAPDGWLAVVRPSLLVGLVVLIPILLLRSGPHLVLTTTTASLLAGATIAQAPEPVTVYVIGSSNGFAVLAPPAVLDKLTGVIRSSGPAIAIVAADYEGSAEGPATASFTATYRVVVGRDGDQTLSLPLTGTRLTSLTIDDRPAFPDGSRPDRYDAMIRGIGSHTVVAKFQVALAISGPDRDVRLGVPDVAGTTVAFVGPAGAVGLDVPTRRGAFSTTSVGNRPRVVASHGGGRALEIRWRETASVATVAVGLTAKLAAVWDLAEAGESLTTALVFTTEGGSVNRLGIEIPDGYEPSRPIVRTADPRGPGLKDWALAAGPEGWQTLTLGLQGPIDGKVTVVLRLTPRRPGAGRPILRFPRAAAGIPTDGFYAIRLNGVTTDDLPRSGVLDYPADGLAREFPGIAELDLDRAPPDRAFRQSHTGSAELRPVLHLPNDAVGSSEVIWTVGPRIEAEGIVRVGGGPVSVVEFDLSNSVTVAEVRGPEVHGWTRTGSRIQVWLTKPTRDPVVRWLGSRAPPTATGTTVRSIDLPWCRPSPGGGTNSLRIRPLPGWLVVPETVVGLTSRPSINVAEEFFAVDPSAPSPRFGLLPPDSSSHGAIQEAIDKVENGGRYRAVVTLPGRTDRPRHFTLHGTGLTAMSDATVRGPNGVRIGPATPTADGLAWTVLTPPMPTGSIVLQLTASIPLPGSIPEPTLTFDGPPMKWEQRQPIAPSGWRCQREGDGWQISPLPSPPATAAPTAPAVVPPTIDPIRTNDGPYVVRGWAAGLAWVVAFVLVVSQAGRARPQFAPELLVGCGLLGVTAAGLGTIAGYFFLAIVGCGLIARVAWALIRLARVVLR